MNIYVDTNVYLDYFFDRKDHLRPLGELAFRVFEDTLLCTHKIIISDWVIDEVVRFIPKGQSRLFGNSQYQRLLTF